MAHEIHTLAAEFRHEGERIKGSRFIATVAPSPTVAAAEGFVERIRSEFPAATHHCWAYRVGPTGEAFRASDDGEPGGSAGRPILQQLEGHGLTNAVVVVTRWYGGTKLGVGGLMRAYGGAAGHALDRAERRIVILKRRLDVRFPYDCTGAVQGLLSAHGIEPASADYGAAVHMVLDVPERDLEEFTSALRDRTAGRVEMEDR